MISWRQNNITSSVDANLSWKVSCTVAVYEYLQQATVVPFVLIAVLHKL